MATREEIQARIDDATAREKAAMLERHRAEAELAALDGREWDRQYHEAYADSQSGVPGGHERFWALVSERDARDVISGAKALTDFMPYERPGIQRAMERIRAVDAKEATP
jgi:hypothetical protein